MLRMSNTVYAGLAVALCLLVVACGGGGSLSPAPPTPPPTGSNVAAVTVDSGPTVSGTPVGDINSLFTSVTVCVPGSTTNCQTIDHVQVDTGSYGLRILSSALTLSLPLTMDTGGNSLGECLIFGIGFSWGPIVSADVKIAGETASAIPVQIIGDPRLANVPSGCTGAGGAENTVTNFGANGLLGIGPFAQDCPGCTTGVPSPAQYYACTSTTCTPTTVPLANQVVNPVFLFPKDNNGVIIQLPSVGTGGAATLSGTLTFGIDTESDNVSGSQTVLTLDGEAELAMIYMGTTLNQSFVDSGSNGIFFFDPNITQCAGSGFQGFYCPGVLQNLAVSLVGRNNMMANNLTFNIASAQAIPINISAYPPLGGTIPTAIGAQSFDYGLAFFYGKRVAIGNQGFTTTVGTGPYIAF
jgi:Protein of unknown function (DUF3443)